MGVARFNVLWFFLTEIIDEDMPFAFIWPAVVEIYEFCCFSGSYSLRLDFNSEGTVLTLCRGHCLNLAYITVVF
jgi:hypothetical protein